MIIDCGVSARMIVMRKTTSGENQQQG